jgi:hypothetical protein
MDHPKTTVVSEVPSGHRTFHRTFERRPSTAASHLKGRLDAALHAFACAAGYDLRWTLRCIALFSV